MPPCVCLSRGFRMERGGPVAVLADEFVYLGREADDLIQGDNDLPVLCRRALTRSLYHSHQ